MTYLSIVFCVENGLTYTLKSLNHVNHRNIKIRQSYTISLVSSMGTRHYIVLLFNSLGRQFEIGNLKFGNLKYI